MLSCTSVRYVESRQRQRYSNDVNSYYFLQLHEWTHNTSNVYAQDYTTITTPHFTNLQIMAHWQKFYLVI